MVPNHPHHPTVAVLQETDTWARAFTGDVALVWGVKDPILGRSLRRVILICYINLTL
jgi:haloalkane dehalogenase